MFGKLFLTAIGLIALYVFGVFVVGAFKVFGPLVGVFFLIAAGFCVMRFLMTENRQS